MPAGDFVFVNAALDAGATAVIVPQIESADQAAQAVAAAFYPPRGGRSWGQLEQTWGRPVVEAQAANARTRCAVMIESESGLDHVEEIAAVAPDVFWFQLYRFSNNDHKIGLDLVRRGLTVDSARRLVWKGSKMRSWSAALLG